MGETQVSLVWEQGEELAGGEAGWLSQWACVCREAATELAGPLESIIAAAPLEAIIP